MSQSKLISILKQVVAEELRKVIKEELSEILQEGLQSTINEMKSAAAVKSSNGKYNELPIETRSNRKVNFKENKFSNILNDTESLREDTPLSMNSYADLMTEDITMTSADALNFGAARKMPMQHNMSAPAIMTDLETGKNIEVDPMVAKAMTRDYSALMKAIDKKRGK
jgi:hypothetical protein